MRKQIESREDIKLLIDEFYNKVRRDEVIGYIFNDIARVQWDHHLPIMYDFWETVLLDTGKYSRNAMEPHFRLNEKVKLLPAHFDRWKQLFFETLDEYFEGEKVKEAKLRVHSIAGIMQLKMEKLNRPFSMINPEKKE